MAAWNDFRRAAASKIRNVEIGTFNVIDGQT